MGYIRNVFVAAGFAGLLGSAHAETDAVPMAKVAPVEKSRLQYTNMLPTQGISDNKMHTITYFLNDAVLNDGRIVVERSRVDMAVGVTCEWRGTGKFNVDDRGYTRVGEVTIHERRCADTVDLPNTWIKVTKSPNPDDTILLEHNRLVDENDRSLVREWTMSVGSGDNIISRFEREWNLAKGEVCVKSSEGLPTMSGDMAPYLVQDWGCFPMKDTPYANAIKRSYGGQGPF